MKAVLLIQQAFRVFRAKKKFDKIRKDKQRIIEDARKREEFELAMRKYRYDNNLE